MTDGLHDYDRINGMCRKCGRHASSSDATPCPGGIQNAVDKASLVFSEVLREGLADVEAMKQPLRVQILQEGTELTNGSRDVEYGKPAVNMAAAGELKAVFRKHLRREISEAELEAIDMALTKLGRLATGKKPKRDTYVDAATYIAIAGEIALDGAS